MCPYVKNIKQIEANQESLCMFVQNKKRIVCIYGRIACNRL